METDHENVLAPLIVLILELTAGILSNGFFVSVIFYDFNRQKNMSSSNKILASLGIANVSYAIVISAGLLEEFIGPQASSSLVLSSMYITLLLYSISSCAWLTAGLGAFYFIKISQARLVSWVKFRISSIVPWMLLVLEVLSFVNSFFSNSLLISPRFSSRNITDSPPSAITLLAKNRSVFMNAVLTVTTIPFLMVLASTMCTIWTLRRHSQKMKRSVETGDNGRLTSFERVVERMTRFLSFYGIFYMLMLIFYFSIIAHLKSGFWISLLLLSSFTPVQSVLLILGIPRIKEALTEMLDYRIFPRLCGSNEG